MPRLRPFAIIAGLLLTASAATACDGALPEPAGSSAASPEPVVTAPATATIEAPPSVGSTAVPTFTMTPAAVVPPPDLPVTSTPASTPPMDATTAPISISPVAVPGRTLVLAPIEKVEVMATKSIPAQYTLAVTSGLPGGCAKFAGSTVEVKDDLVIVKVYNSMPSAPTACTMIYGYTTHGVRIGALTPGKAYKIQVNDQTIGLVAQ